MKVFYSEEHRKHEPPFEVYDGGLRTPYLENSERMERLLQALQPVDWVEFCEPVDFRLDPILAVHVDKGTWNCARSPSQAPVPVKLRLR